MAQKRSSLKSWFRGIKGKLLMAAFMPLLGFGMLAFVSLQGLDRIVVLLENSNEQVIPAFDNLGEMRQSRNKYLYHAWQAIHAQTPEERTKAIQSAAEALDEFKTAEELYSASNLKEEEIKLLEPVKPLFPEYYTSMEQVVKLVESGDPQKIAEAKVLMEGKIKETGSKVRIWNRDLVVQLRKYADEGHKDAVATKKSVIQSIALITAVSGLVIFSVLLLIAAKVAGSVGAISQKLTEAGGSVASSVAQLSEAGNSLSQSSTAAAASLEETVAALEEMTSMVKMNSDNAKQAAALSASSKEAAERGESEIQSLIQSMNNISQSSKKIEEIISVIDDIAFQTNLLALNAAVEAARAGEQGKGFAVVAEAVRALAQRSASAAKDITSLIKDSVSQIEEGSKIADQSGAVLSNITNSVKKVADLNNEIAAASSEQTTGIQQISKAMNQLDQSSQGNAASAEEIAATTGEINQLAVSTQNLTVELNEAILGSDDSAQSSLPDHEAKLTEKSETSSHKSKPVSTKNVMSLTPKKSSNVVQFKPAAKSSPKKAAPAPTASQKPKDVAAATIPFDEDDERAKVGTTDGF